MDDETDVFGKSFDKSEEPLRTTNPSHCTTISPIIPSLHTPLICLISIACLLLLTCILRIHTKARLWLALVIRFPDGDKPVQDGEPATPLTMLSEFNLCVSSADPTAPAGDRSTRTKDRITTL